MKIYTYFILFFLSFSFNAQDNRIPLDTTIVTLNSVTIKGKKVPYKAITGMQPVWNSNGKAANHRKCGILLSRRSVTLSPRPALAAT